MKATTDDSQETRQRRAEAWERIQRLQARVSARNRDLTVEQAERIADELGQAAIESLRKQGQVSFERDQS